MGCEYKYGFNYEYADEDTVLKQIRNKQWATATGKEIPIASMEISHIIRCIAWLKRTFTDGFMLDYIPLFEAEIKSRFNAMLIK